jgi:hypothetical protein
VGNVDGAEKSLGVDLIVIIAAPDQLPAASFLGPERGLLFSRENE